MHPFPHRYEARASAAPADDISLTSPRLPEIRSAAPQEFGGPGDRWSPETLLVAAVADCFILTFRAIAGMSRLSWTRLTCEVSGTVDRVDRVTQFTALAVRARLLVPSDAQKDQAERLLHKAEENCLVTRSLKVAPTLVTSVEVGDSAG